MKKWASLMLCLMMVMSILAAGCGGGGGSSTPTTGSIVGYLYSDGAGLQITNSATPPASKIVNSGIQRAYAPANGGTITVVGTTYTATTGANGAFTISGVPTGSYTLTATMGSLTESFPITVTAGGQATPANDPIRAIKGGVDVSLATFNGKKIYSIISAQPASKPEGYGSPLTTYPFNLGANAPASPATVPSVKLSEKSFVASGVLSTKQIQADNQMRQKEIQLLANRSKQYNRSLNGINPAAPATINVGTTWNNVNIVTNGTQISTTCRYISSHAYIFVDNRDIAAMESQMADYGTSFDSIYQKNHQYFGNENDTDNNGKVIIVFSRELTGGLLGYFYGGDKFSKTSQSDSNEGDIFYLTTDTYSGTVVKGTLAHEFQHMIYFDQHYNRNVVDSGNGVWLNEALSQAAEYYNGYTDNHNAWMANYLNGNWGGLSLTHWTSGNYGYGALFARYLIDQYGDAAIKNMCSTDKIGVAAVESATGADFNNIYNDFTRALVMSGTNDSTNPRYKFKTLNLQQIQPSGRGGLTTTFVFNVGYGFGGDLFPYRIFFSEWTGTFGVILLSGDSMNGTAFGLSR